MMASPSKPGIVCRVLNFDRKIPRAEPANRNSRCQLAHVSLLDCEFSNSGSKHGSRSVWFNEFPPDDACCFFHAVFHLLGIGSDRSQVSGKPHRTQNSYLLKF